MSLLEKIQNYIPTCEQEERDKEVMIQFIRDNPNYLDRSNLIAHFTTSIWTVNKEHTKTLMAYHNIYDSWAWIGGHADGIEDLCQVALRELQEETGISSGTFSEIGRCIIKDTIYYQFLCTTDWDKTAITLQPGETTGWQWVSEEAFIAFINSDRMIPRQHERFRDFFRRMGYLR